MKSGGQKASKCTLCGQKGPLSIVNSLMRHEAHLT